MEVIRNLVRLRTPSAVPRSYHAEDTQRLQPILTIHVPGYGSIRMIEPSPLQNEPRQDYILNGHLEIFVPQPLGRLRCRLIKIGFRSILTLRPSPDSPEEVDTLYDTDTELQGADGGGSYTWLEVGNQRFQFSLIIPGDLAPHDGGGACPGRIKQDVYAEVSGVERASVVPIQTTSHANSSSPAASSQNPSGTLNMLSSGVSRTELSTLHAGSQRTASQPTTVPKPDDPGILAREGLQDTVKAQRRVRVRYNPNRDGGCSKLEDVSSAHVPGIGLNDLEMTSDVFTIGAPVRVRCGLSSLSSKTTIYQYQVNLEQRTTYVSLRDSRSRSTTQTYKILERGTRPLKTPVKIPDDQISLWSGTDVGGHDVDSFKFDQTGRLPNDLHARPSTPSMVVSPIRTSHLLVVQILLSVHGEDAAGRQCCPPGPGALRHVRISRRVQLPHCTFIPSILDPPTYPDTPTSAPFKGEKTDEPCPLCASRSYADICDKCPADIPSHLTSVHDSQTCPHCGHTSFPLGASLWHKCACRWDDIPEVNRRQAVVSAQMEETVHTQDPVEAKLRAEGRR